MKEKIKSLLRFLRNLLVRKEVEVYPPTVRFTYGWYCPKCKHVTEHQTAYREDERYLICQECGLSTYFPIRSPRLIPKCETRLQL